MMWAYRAFLMGRVHLMSYRRYLRGRLFMSSIGFIFRQIFNFCFLIIPKQSYSAMLERSVTVTAGGMARNLLLRRE